MAEKQPKSAVDYGPGKPRGDHCAICRHFEPPHGCERVLGRISPQGWCRLFRRKRPFYDHPRSVDRDRDVARRSLGEENKAIEDYGARARTARSPALREVFEHNRAEERQHAAGLRRWLKDRPR